MGAFVLSVLSGLLAGVGLGTVLVRGVLWAFLFGVGGAAIVAVAHRLLPGLVSSSADSVSAADGDGPPVEAERKGALSGGRLNIVVEDDGTEPETEMDAAPDGADHEGELVEEVAEQSAGDEAEVMESFITAESEPDSGPGSDELDEIPDIGGFAGSFVGSEDEDSEAAAEAGSADTKGHGRGNTGNAGNSPEEIAQALRTMMNRDK